MRIKQTEEREREELKELTLHPHLLTSPKMQPHRFESPEDIFQALYESRQFYSENREKLCKKIYSEVRKEETFSPELTPNSKELASRRMQRKAFEEYERTINKNSTDSVTSRQSKSLTREKKKQSTMSYTNDNLLSLGDLNSSTGEDTLVFSTTSTLLSANQSGKYTLDDNNIMLSPVFSPNKPEETNGKLKTEDLDNVSGYKGSPGIAAVNNDHCSVSSKLSHSTNKSSRAKYTSGKYDVTQDIGHLLASSVSEQQLKNLKERSRNPPLSPNTNLASLNVFSAKNTNNYEDKKTDDDSVVSALTAVSTLTPQSIPYTQHIKSKPSSSPRAVPINSTKSICSDPKPGSAKENCRVTRSTSPNAIRYPRFHNKPLAATDVVQPGKFSAGQYSRPTTSNNSSPNPLRKSIVENNQEGTNLSKKKLERKAPFKISSDGKDSYDPREVAVKEILSKMEQKSLFDRLYEVS